MMMILIISACGTKAEDSAEKDEKKQKVEEKVKYFEADDKKYSYDIDAVYFGNIEFGKNKINMINNYITLKENDDVEMSFSGVDSYKIKSSGDRFILRSGSYTDSYEIKFLTYTDIYEEKGIHMYDSSNSIKLPKNITYNSTIEDVLKAYGEPEKRRECLDVGRCVTKNSLNENFIEAETLTYKYEKNNCIMNLELRFEKNTKKLYYVYYEIEIPEVK